MRRFEGLGDLFRDGKRVVDRDRAVRDAIRQRGPFDELEDPRSDRAALALGFGFGFFRPVDVPDVGVVQGGEELGFALEAGEAIGIGRERVWQDLERHVAVELRVAGAVDLAHTAVADLAGNGVRTEAVTDGQSHGRVSLRLPR